MYKLCVFAGTTEGRELVEYLSGTAVEVSACVATEYGEALLTPAENIHIAAGRLTEAQMETFFRTEEFSLVIDATHPYADVVTENIARACEVTGTEYLRLLRSGTKDSDAVFVESVEGAVSYLNDCEGNVLLTTGSKDLRRFSSLQDFAQRVYVRVLPMEESLCLCGEAGVKPAHIFAMQGPFSQSMNEAMLQAMQARYMVTKDSGSAGGFEEKMAAAHRLGVTAVVIGRPPQREGLDLIQVKALLRDRFSLKVEKRVSVVGIGPAGGDTMTGQVRLAIAEADCLLGARRMLETVALPKQTAVEMIAPAEIAAYIQSHDAYSRFAVVMSGDTGFFSGTKKLLPLLEDCRVQVLPGVSSLSYLCAKLGTSYEDVVTVSTHGRETSILPQIRHHGRVFTLLGGDNGLGELCRELTTAGLGHVKICAGERLGYPEERIVTGTAEALANERFHSLCAALIENPTPVGATAGLPDGSFVRSETVPMTKSEVRVVCLSKLRLSEDAIVWDIGAGTGSVTVEIALQALRGHIYAIECKDEALSLLHENCNRFGTDHVTVVPGTAPEVCHDLPAPSHAFLGGTGGGLREIIALLLEKNPTVRIVATAIALETAAELTACMKEFSFTETEVVSLTVARDKKAGPYHLMTGQNPIYIFTMQGGGTPCTH